MNTIEPLEINVSRRLFSVASALALLSGVAITVSGCGSGSSPSSPSTPAPTPTPSAGNTDKVGGISGNHGHSAVITGGQITAAGALALDIRGTASHPHTVQLTSAEIVAIGGGQTRSKESSSDDGHSHTVTFN
jgi:hypothetical protein